MSSSARRIIKLLANTYDKNFNANLTAPMMSKSVFTDNMRREISVALQRALSRQLRTHYQKRVGNISSSDGWLSGLLDLPVQEHHQDCEGGSGALRR